MTRRIVRVFDTLEHVAHAAATEFVAVSHESVDARGRFVIALAGGSTPRRLYELLGDESLCDQVDWPKLEFFWGDERPVPPDHAESNFGMVKQALLNNVKVAARQIHRMPAERPDLDAAARDYQN